jgi:hypothetical protein
MWGDKHTKGLWRKKMMEIVWLISIMIRYSYSWIPLYAYTLFLYHVIFVYAIPCLVLFTIVLIVHFSDTHTKGLWRKKMMEIVWLISIMIRYSYSWIPLYACTRLRRVLSCIFIVLCVTKLCLIYSYVCFSCAFQWHAHKGIVTKENDGNCMIDFDHDSLQLLLNPSHACMLLLYLILSWLLSFVCSSTFCVICSYFLFNLDVSDTHMKGLWRKKMMEIVWLISIMIRYSYSWIPSALVHLSICTGDCLNQTYAWNIGCVSVWKDPWLVVWLSLNPDR